MAKKKPKQYGIHQLTNDCFTCFNITDDEMKLAMMEAINLKIRWWRMRDKRLGIWAESARVIAWVCNNLLEAQDDDSTKEYVRFLLSSLYADIWLSYKAFTNWKEI